MTDELQLHPDIAAMIDVLNDMNETTDALGIEDAVALRESVVELRRKAGVLLGLIDTQLISILESPREIGGQRYRIANDGKWKPDHSKVTAAIKERAVLDRETGELRPAGDAVEVAMKLMADCYVSPSGMPKTGALDSMGLDKSDVARFDGKGKKVAVEPVQPT